MSHVTFSCIGEHAKDKQFYNTEASCGAPVNNLQPKRTYEEEVINDGNDQLLEEFGTDYGDHVIGADRSRPGTDYGDYHHGAGSSKCEGIKTDPNSKINIAQTNAKIQLICKNGCLKIHKVYNYKT